MIMRTDRRLSGTLGPRTAGLMAAMAPVQALITISLTSSHPRNTILITLFIFARRIFLGKPVFRSLDSS